MKTILTPHEMRLAEQALIKRGISEIELMRQAADGLFSAVNDWRGTVGILCGSGNNAGDGYALAVLLKQAGCSPILLRASDRITPASAYFRASCTALSIPEITPDEIGQLSASSWLVDCLFGIGFHGEVPESYRALINWCNQSNIPILSADIPSGLSALTGNGSSVIRAAVTVAIGAYKPGHFFGIAPDVCGKLCLAPIGLESISLAVPTNENIAELNHDTPSPIIEVSPASPASNSPAAKPLLSAKLIEASDIASIFAPRPHCCHKGSFGTALLLGGSAEYSGAPKLTNLAAASVASMRCGCGIARLALPESLIHSAAPYLLESTLCPMPQKEGKIIFHEKALERAFSGVRSAAIGMGWGTSDSYPAILAYILKETKIPTVIDADGLNTLAHCDLSMLRRPDSAPVILTPHPKEFERLSGIPMAEILIDPIGTAAHFAEAHSCIVLLKGASTVITDGKTSLITSTGCGGMATAGSGDVLSGILAALLSYSPLSPLLTVAAGAHLAGLAGEIAEKKIGSVAMIASDTVSALPEAIRKISDNLIC